MFKIAVSGGVREGKETPMEVTILGCPYDGIKAIDFRRANGLPEAPSNKISLPPFAWHSESDARKLPLDGNADCNAPDFSVHEFSVWNDGNIHKHTYASGKNVATASVIAAYLAEQTEATAMALLIDMLDRNASNLRKAEAEAEAGRPERERLAAEKAANIERGRIATLEAKAKKAEGENALRVWANQNGSELLKARIEGGFEWVELAEQEFAAAVISDLGEEAEIPDGECESTERTTPSLPEINRLNEAIKLLEGKPASAKLIWCTYTEEIDEYDNYGDEEPTVVKQSEIEVTVTCPTGAEIVSYFPCKSTETVDA